MGGIQDGKFIESSIILEINGIVVRRNPKTAPNLQVLDLQNLSSSNKYKGSYQPRAARLTVCQLNMLTCLLFHIYNSL